MEWQPVGTITTSSNYAFTPIITGTLFKLKHINQSLSKSNLKIAIRQAFEDNGDLALFDYKLINCKVEQDIILFSLPKGLTNRRLAFKRVDNYLDESWIVEIESLDIVEDGVNLPISISDVVDLQNRLDTIQNELSIKALDLDLDSHVAAINNPHNVTALQIGAELKGSAIATVEIHEGTVNHPVASSSNKGMISAADKSKLDGIENGATANQSNNYSLNRANHGGIDTVEAWITPVLQNGWEIFSPDNALGYRKLPDGTVELKGLTKKVNTSTDGQAIFTLPVGYRPQDYKVFIAISNNGVGRIDIDTNGNVAFQLGSNSWISLNNIRFAAAS